MNKLQLESGILKKVFLGLVVSLAVGLGSCSGDDDETPGGGSLLPTGRWETATRICLRAARLLPSILMLRQVLKSENWWIMM